MDTGTGAGVGAREEALVSREIAAGSREGRSSEGVEGPAAGEGVTSSEVTGATWNERRSNKASGRFRERAPGLKGSSELLAQPECLYYMAQVSGHPLPHKYSQVSVQYILSNVVSGAYSLHRVDQIPFDVVS